MVRCSRLRAEATCVACIAGLRCVAAIFASLRCRRACWRLDANVPCGRASACSFAMLVLRCPSSIFVHCGASQLFSHRFAAADQSARGSDINPNSICTAGGTAVTSTVVAACCHIAMTESSCCVARCVVCVSAPRPRALRASRGCAVSRGAAFGFAMLVFCCPASENAALLSTPDNASLVCMLALYCKFVICVFSVLVAVVEEKLEEQGDTLNQTMVELCQVIHQR